MWIGTGGGVDCDPIPYIAQLWLGISVGYPPTHGIPADVSYLFSEHGGSGLRDRPVERCKVRAATSTGLCVHFLHQHTRYTIIVLEEVNPPTHSVSAAI